MTVSWSTETVWHFNFTVCLYTRGERVWRNVLQKEFTLAPTGKYSWARHEWRTWKTTHHNNKKKEVLILSIYWKTFLIFMCELSGGIFCINTAISKKRQKKKNHLSSNTLKIINRKNPHRKQSLKNERNKRNDWNHMTTNVPVMLQNPRLNV